MKWTKEVEQEIYQYIDSFKDLISSDLWDNILLDCSKNEILVLWFLYQQKEVNMTQIAEYIHVPLNTATGILTRMEKRNLVIRQRSEEDKRIVIICLSEKGMGQIEAVIKEIAFYVKKVYAEFTKEEMALFLRMFHKLMEIMKQKRTVNSKTRIRKITIE